MRALAFLVLAPALALAAPAVKAPSKIEFVTVYRSTARVVRVSKVELQGGASRVVLEGLPDGLDDDSIRVEGKGSARARLFGVSVERVTGEGAAAVEARAAEDRLERLQDEDRGLEDRLKAAQARVKLVESLRSTYSEERARNMAVREVSTKEWAGVAVFVEDQLASAAAGIRKLEALRRELARSVAQARADLEKVQAKRARTTKAVAIEVEAERAGDYEVAVSYTVPAAGWQPVWDARLQPESAKVELAFHGSVWQRSGEDWSDVTLAVSTAEPARGLFVPQLEAHYLQKAQPVPVYRSRGMAMPSAAPSAAMKSAEQRSEAYAEEAPTPEVVMDVAQASLSEGVLSATFTAPRRETVDGSGQARKIPLARFPLAAQVTRTAAPRVTPTAFLTAKAVNETGFPLLAGQAGVYVGDEYAGRAALPFTPAGGELELAFGADDRVEIERRVLERRRESAGVLTKDEVYRYRVRIALKNRWAAPVGVKLLDLVPVSRDEKIKIELLEGTTAPTREDPERPGVRIYELQLGPREEKVVELRYEVRFPRGFPIQGLE